MVTTVTKAVEEAKEETAKNVALVKNATDSITQLMETLSLLEMPTEDVEEDGGQSNEN